MCNGECVGECYLKTCFVYIGFTSHHPLPCSGVSGRCLLVGRPVTITRVTPVIESRVTLCYVTLRFTLRTETGTMFQ